MPMPATTSEMMIKIHSVSEMAVSRVFNCMREIEAGVTVRSGSRASMTSFSSWSRSVSVLRRRQLRGSSVIRRLRAY